MTHHQMCMRIAERYSVNQMISREARNVENKRMCSLILYNKTLYTVPNAIQVYNMSSRKTTERPKKIAGPSKRSAKHLLLPISDVVPRTACTMDCACIPSHPAGSLACTTLPRTFRCCTIGQGMCQPNDHICQRYRKVRLTVTSLIPSISVQSFPTEPPSTGN